MRERAAVLLVLGIAAAFLLHLAIGTGLFALPEVLRGLIAGPPGLDAAPEQVVVWTLRLPRAIAALATGAALAMSGSALQALFRNPLAEPYILGISSGAAVGGVLATITGIEAVTGAHGTFLTAFASAILCMALVLLYARTRIGISTHTLLLAGVTLGTFLWALVTLLLTVGGADANRILFWLLGSFVGADWSRVTTVAGVTLLGGGALLTLSRPLTLFAVGEETASTLGVSVERLKWWALLTASALAASAVSAFGIIGFVGMFVPHLARRLYGASMSASLPAAAALGGTVMLIADLIAQRLLPGREINVGVLTALMAAPFLLLVARRREHRE